jgi:hypothetical protein
MGVTPIIMDVPEVRPSQRRSSVVGRRSSAAVAVTISFLVAGPDG